MVSGASEANILRDPKEHREAVLGDFVHAITFAPSAWTKRPFVYGSRFKQRYFTKRGDHYYPLPSGT